MVNPTLLVIVLETLTLGKDITSKTVLAPRDAKLCKPAPALITLADAKPTLAPDSLSYRVVIENPSDKPIALCLMRFSVIGSPLLMFSLSAASGLADPPRMPEVYPIADEKVPFETLTLPARTRLAVDATQPIPRKSYAAAKDLKLNWTIIINHEYRGGSIAVHP